MMILLPDSKYRWQSENSSNHYVYKSCSKWLLSGASGSKDAQSTTYKQKFEIKVVLLTGSSAGHNWLSLPQLLAGAHAFEHFSCASRPTDANARPCSLLPKWLSTHWRTVGSNGWNLPRIDTHNNISTVLSDAGAPVVFKTWCGH